MIMFPSSSLAIVPLGFFSAFSLSHDHCSPFISHSCLSKWATIFVHRPQEVCMLGSVIMLKHFWWSTGRTLVERDSWKYWVMTGKLKVPDIIQMFLDSLRTIHFPSGEDCFCCSTHVLASAHTVGIFCGGLPLLATWFLSSQWKRRDNYSQ